MDTHLFGHADRPTFESALSQAISRRAGNSLTQRSRSKTAPRLSYGRHKGPARDHSRQAAVVCVLYPDRHSGRMCLTLTRRPVTLSHHGGQICLPGGKIESGETSCQAALREYEEELGVPINAPVLCGSLTPIYVFGSDNVVETLVVCGDSPLTDWQPDPVEVDRVIELPLHSLGETFESQLNLRKQVRNGKVALGDGVFHYEFSHHAFSIRDVHGAEFEIWGATAMLLEELSHCLIDCQTDS